MSGQIYGFYIFRGISLCNLINQLQGLQRKQKKYFKKNIQLYTTTYFNISRSYLHAIKLKLEFATNGMQYNVGEPIIGRIFLSQKFYSKRLYKVVNLFLMKIIIFFVMIQAELLQENPYTFFLLFLIASSFSTL